MTHTWDKHSITAIVLAGGLGRRMGGVDKGLQPFRGKPLALHGLERLQAQKGDLIAGQMISANRHLPVYERFGVPVHADVLDGHLGPLAGFLTGLEHCPTPYLLTVPCDAPRYPLDLAQRLASALAGQGADIAIAATRAQDGHLIPQPVFSLLSASLLPHLRSFLASGGRKVGEWATSHAHVRVVFDQPGDDPQAFANANTLADLQALDAS